MRFFSPFFLISLLILGPQVSLSFSTRRCLLSRNKATAIYRRQASVRLHAKNKGFGNIPDSPKKQKKAPDFAQELEESLPAPAAEIPVKAAATSPSQDLNAGQRALNELRRQRAEQKDEELRKIRELLVADQQLQQTPAAIPEKVAQRMGQRMLPFVGIPLFLGMGSFVAFWYLATYKNMEFQPSMVATTTVFILVVGLLVRCWIALVIMTASFKLNLTACSFFLYFVRESLIPFLARPGIQIEKVTLWEPMNFQRIYKTFEMG